MFAWGSNRLGQLGLGYDSELELVPLQSGRIDDPTYSSEIESICGGAVHTLLLKKIGLVYSCGGNFAGQLGLSEPTRQFSRIRGLEGHNIVKVACGFAFSAAISATGQLFTWGSNENYQLGLPVPLLRMSAPTLLQIGSVTGVSCGSRHIAIVLSSGRVMVSGQGDLGQLGLVNKEGQAITHCALKYNTLLENIRSVACGGGHTLALHADGSVYGWGDNANGQLGINPDITTLQKTPVKLNINVAVKEILAGGEHSVILTHDGEIFNFGFNGNGQLGDSRAVTWQPQQLQCEKILRLSVGSEHNVAVTSSQKLLCWGWNELGNCGNGTMTNVERPERILNNYDQFRIGTGFAHSFAIL